MMMEEAVVVDHVNPSLSTSATVAATTARCCCCVLIHHQPSLNRRRGEWRGGAAATARIVLQATKQKAWVSWEWCWCRRRWTLGWRRWSDADRPPPNISITQRCWWWYTYNKQTKNRHLYIYISSACCVFLCYMPLLMTLMDNRNLRTHSSFVLYTTLLFTPPHPTQPSLLSRLYYYFFSFYCLLVFTAAARETSTGDDKSGSFLWWRLLRRSKQQQHGIRDQTMLGNFPSSLSTTTFVCLFVVRLSSVLLSFFYYEYSSDFFTI